MTKDSWHFPQSHNTALRPKIEIREHILAGLAAEAHVLDCYAGPVGEMYNRVWHRAASYTGIDREWLGLVDRRRRFVGDTLVLLRAIDLAKYNVFDVDCYGDPWSAMLMIQRHRRWAPGERGAVVFTDGAFIPAALHGVSHALGQALGKTVRAAPATRTNYGDARSQALTRWLDRSKLTAVAGWHAEVHLGCQMYYGGLIFEGTKASSVTRVG